MTIIGAFHVVHFCTSVKECRERPMKAPKKPSPPGKEDRPQAVDEGRYGVVRCRYGGRRGKTFPHMSFRANAVSRGIFSSGKFILCWFIIQRGGFLHSACAQGLNDRRFQFGCYKCKRTTIPALRAGWRQIAAATVGVPCIGWYHSSEQVVFDTWRSADCRPYDTFVPYSVFLTFLSSFCVRKNVKNVIR